MRHMPMAVAAWVLVTAGSGLAALAADESSPPANPPIKTPGLGDPGRLTAVKIVVAGEPALNGPDARKQLLVDGRYASGQVRDVTPTVAWTASPAGIVSINPAGLITPLADGTAKIVATVGGAKASTKIEIKNFGTPRPINFANQIVPIFTKNGCNSGGCHGKSTGQNGFRLSLLGFYPSDDYEFLVKEGRGRRLFPSAPDQSLLLLKASNTVPHGGGHRLDRDGFEYGLIVRWLEQGMPYGKPDDPVVERIEVFPASRAMERDSQQQLAVLAHYTDGSVEDVTHVAQYESNDGEMAEASATGLAHTLGLTGDVAVMARFQGQVSVFRATLPLGIEVADKDLPPRRNFIDELVFAKLKALGIPPSPLCDDATFVRRVSLDIAGRLPTGDEAQAFVADNDPQKRDKLIDRLLDSAGYADYFANKWSVILRNQRVNQNYTRGTYSFHDWIRRSLLSNKPYDQFVREIVGASGEMGQNPPVAWYRAVETAEKQLEDTAQLFLGLRLQCARCHHHPFERWSQHDYYSFAAFFSRVGRKNGINGLQPRDEQRIFHNRGPAQARNPRSGEDLKPAGLGGEPLTIEPDHDPRQTLVDWMASPDNPFFASALANRYWKHFLGRGIVEPEDDMRVTNPASNPELMRALAKHFLDSRFDMKDLIRTICRSTTYQLSSEPNDYNASDKQNFSYFHAKRLNAEVLYDALNQVTATVTNFNGLPTGTRAVQLPDSGVNNYFLTVFGRPMATSPCECERSQEANLAQSLHLLNSNEVQGKLQAGEGRAAKLAREKDREDDDKVRELYAWAYARSPDAGELSLTLEYLDKHPNKQQAFEDILWALINTKEFLFNH
ncbi:MAG TPA: DUF1549 domain-containing protein [Pirellulales bacterium]|nr:DUF1549 domain-containing protein [Pirellulales bacterium]